MTEQLDQLASFELSIRTTGEWCDVSVKDDHAHKFIARNPMSNVAISLCGTYVKPIEKLHINHVSPKCLVCSLYSDMREEGLDKIKERLDAIVARNESKQETNQPIQSQF